MAIVIDGLDYDVQEPSEIALELAGRINDFCSENGIVNEDGEVIRIDVNNASIPWLILLAQGYSDSVLQRLMRAVASNFNFGECSEEQLLELARIARVKRREASFTTVMVNIEATPLGIVHIEKTDTATVILESTTLIFHPAYNIDVPADEIRSLVFIADKAGPYSVRENSIRGFDIEKENVKLMTSAAGVPGRKEETLTDLRWRMETGRGSGSDLENAMDAIQQLPGVSFCNIFINDDNAQDMYVNEVLVHPRNSVLFVQGYSDDIAQAYYNYMTMKTTPDNWPPTERTIVQDKITNAGQHIPVYIIAPQQSDVYIRVYVESKITSGITEQIQNILLEFNSTYGIGKNISSLDIMNKLEAQGLSYNILGCRVSMDGMIWDVASNVSGGSILRIQRDNITAEEWIPFIPR